MTQIRFRERDASGAALIGATYTYVPVNAWTDDDGRYHKAPATIALDSATVTVDIPSPPSDNATTFTPHFTGGRSRTVIIPVSGSVIDFEDLTEVDPSTLTEVSAGPAWTAVAAAAAASAAAAAASAVDATDSAVDAAASEAATAAAVSAEAVLRAAADATLAPKTALYLAGTNTGDEAAAIQAVLDAAGAEEIVRLYGTFATASTITVKGNLDATGCLINYSGSGVAVQVGTNAAILNRKTVILPRILQSTKPGTGWNAGTVGVKIVNAQSAPSMPIPHVKGFETGVLLYADGGGIVHNNFLFGQLENNKRNLEIDQTNSGWVNQNQFIGGRFSHAVGEGTDVAGTVHVLFGSSYIFNTNTFLGCSFESAGVAEYLLDMGAGTLNQFINCRWESTGVRRVRWGATATNNEINGGYDAANITQTFVTGASRNRIQSAGKGQQFATGTGGGLVLENTSSSANVVLSVMRAGGNAAADDPATAYCVNVGAQKIGGKRYTDTYDRVALDTNLGTVAVGPGTAAPTPIILAGTNARIVFPSYTTAARPAATVGAGSTVYDTTLGKLVTSNGTVWKDNAGTTV